MCAYLEVSHPQGLPGPQGEQGVPGLPGSSVGTSSDVCMQPLLSDLDLIETNLVHII